jgi:hypothetical protein
VTFDRSRLPRGRGRKPGAKGRKAMVRKIARERRVATIDGEKRRVTTAEALILVLVARASKGDTRSYELLLELQRQAGEPVKGCGYLVAPEDLAIEEWIAEQEELNKHRKAPLLPHELSGQDETDT